MVTTVSCRHQGTHLDGHPFLHHSSTNLFLVGILSSFLDRMHRIHLCGDVFSSPLLFYFNLISNDDVIFQSDDDGFIHWDVLWYGYDMLGVHGVEVGLYLLFFFVYLLSLCHRLCARTDTLQHHCMSFSSAVHYFLFQLFTMGIVMKLTCYCWASFSSFSSSSSSSRHIITASSFHHPLLPLVDTLSLHLHFIIIIIIFSH